MIQHLLHCNTRLSCHYHHSDDHISTAHTDLCAEGLLCQPTNQPDISLLVAPLLLYGEPSQVLHLLQHHTNHASSSQTTLPLLTATALAVATTTSTAAVTQPGVLTQQSLLAMQVTTAKKRTNTFMTHKAESTPTCTEAASQRGDQFSAQPVSETPSKWYRRGWTFTSIRATLLH